MTEYHINKSLVRTNTFIVVEIKKLTNYFLQEDGSFSLGDAANQAMRKKTTREIIRVLKTLKPNLKKIRKNVYTDDRV